MFEHLMEALQYHAEHLPEDEKDWGFHHRVTLGAIYSELRSYLRDLKLEEDQLDTLLSDINTDELEGVFLLGEENES